MRRQDCGPWLAGWTPRWLGQCPGVPTTSVPDSCPISTLTSTSAFSSSLVTTVPAAAWNPAATPLLDGVSRRHPLCQTLWPSVGPMVCRGLPPLGVWGAICLAADSLQSRRAELSPAPPSSGHAAYVCKGRHGPVPSTERKGPQSLPLTRGSPQMKGPRAGSLRKGLTWGSAQ